MKLMNLKVLYQWEREIARHFTSFSVWQTKRLARFSMGLIRSESSQQLAIARNCRLNEKAESGARRLRRCIRDGKWSVAQFTHDWTRWVMSRLPRNRTVLLVDETKIRGRFGAMMVGVAFEGRCILLAWRCYQANSREGYPAEGQVKMIAGLLAQIKAALPDDREVMVQADRGIGTSADLCKAVEALGWHYLFRVQKTVKIMTDQGVLLPYKEVRKGGRWSASGSVFIKRGRIPAHVRAIWEGNCAEPWVLVTNNPELTGREYAMRNWQEQGFRDLKSGGWNLEMSRLRCHHHMERFLAILVLAQGWLLAIGRQAEAAKRTRPYRRLPNGDLRRQWSLFKEGLNCFHEDVLRYGRFQTLNFVIDK